MERQADAVSILWVGVSSNELCFGTCDSFWLQEVDSELVVLFPDPKRGTVEGRPVVVPLLVLGLLNKLAKVFGSVSAYNKVIPALVLGFRGNTGFAIVFEVTDYK